MKGPPSPQPTWLKWVTTCLGVAMLAALGVAAPRLWTATLPVVTLFKQGGFAVLKSNGRPVAILAGEYAGALLWIFASVWLMSKPWRKPKAEDSSADKVKDAPPPSATVKISKQAGNKRWSFCNIFQNGAGSRRLWQFDVRGNEFKLNREQNAADNEPLPASTINKSWSSLWQPRLNVAWLPADSVFFRVVHLPQSSPEETLAMVELQMEKLSPIPTGQVVWSVQKLPQSAENMQTLVVVVAERRAVEEFLGKLESQGYLADQLELSQLDQLQASDISENGAWIYPGAWSGHHTALVAWWYGSALQSINFITLPITGDRAASLKDQLSQMTWAGELEGWLTSPPAWHLVAVDSSIAEWEPPLRQALDEPVRIAPPLNAADLAARTARRAANPQSRTGLMLPEFAARYHNQFVDRLWLRAIGAACGVWVAFVLVYFAAVQVLDYHTSGIEQQVASMSGSYTNAIQLKAKLEVLKERQELKYAGLDCWRAVAETMPESVTLENFSFNDGHRLSLNGTAPSDQPDKLTEFNDLIRKYAINGNLLFDPNGGDQLSYRGTPGSPTISWNFSLELKHAEAE